MSRKIIRRREVRERSGYSDSQIWRLEKALKFPARIQLSETAVGWYEDEVTAWIKSRVRGSGRTMNLVLAARQAKRAARASAAVDALRSGGERMRSPQNEEARRG